MTVEYLQKEWGDGCWKLKIFGGWKKWVGKRKLRLRMYEGTL